MDASSNPYAALLEEQDAASPAAGSAAARRAGGAAAVVVDEAAAAAAALRALCTGTLADVLALPTGAAGRDAAHYAASGAAHGALGTSASGYRVLPRGLVNTGNSCFINSTLQALLACGHFCALLARLQEAAPLIDAAKFPALHGLAQLAGSFERPAPPAADGRGTAAATAAQQQQPSGWNEVGKSGRKKGGAVDAPGGASGAASPANPTMVVLGGKPLVPAMLSDVIRCFSPRQAAAAAAAATAAAAASAAAEASASGSVGGETAAAPTPAAAPKPLSMAQRLKSAGTGLEQEQEDAQVRDLH